MFVCLKGLGKFLVNPKLWFAGCLTLSAVIGLAAPGVQQLLVAGLFLLMLFKAVAIFTMWMFIVNLQ